MSGKSNGTNLAVRDESAASIVERVMVVGDLSKLAPKERVEYYSRVCESVGLNPLTQPFEYIQLNGKLRLYARKDATDQLRRLYQVSITSVEKEEINGVMVVTVHARTADGREDTDAGAVPIAGLKGEALANAIMKAITKAKRRVTLSVCGLGWLDETEIETIPDAAPGRVNLETGEIESEPAPAKPSSGWNVLCEDCGGGIESWGDHTPRAVADTRMKRYGRALCEECAKLEKARLQAAKEDAIEGEYRQAEAAAVS